VNKINYSNYTGDIEGATLSNRKSPAKEPLSLNVADINQVHRRKLNIMRQTNNISDIDGCFPKSKMKVFRNSERSCNPLDPQ